MDHDGILRGTAGRMNLMTRPGWSDYYVGLARAAATRGDCTRRQVGAIVVHEHHVFGTGYNGSPRGSSLSCLNGDCPRGKHYNMMPTGSDPYCACGNAIWPCPEYVEPGSDYRNCTSVHAELNAIIDALKHGCPSGASLYCSAKPCADCVKLMQASQIAKYSYPEGLVGMNTIGILSL
jgi:dCMP deaminase